MPTPRVRERRPPVHRPGPRQAGARLGTSSVAASFNVSHSGDHGQVAFAPNGRLGVDVEERHRRHDPGGPIKDVFTPREQAALAAARADGKLRRFFKLWTLKEAAIKALGTGFSLDPAKFEIPASLCQCQRQAEFRFPHLPAGSVATRRRWQPPTSPPPSPTN